MSTEENARYIGDAVYVQKTDMHVILTTASHRLEEADNTIYLEDEVLHSMLDWLVAQGKIKSYTLK